MSLIRLLLYVVIAAFIWFSIKNYLRKQEVRSNPNANKKTVRIVKCQHCHLHLPENEAVAFDNHHFCNKQHLQLWLTQSQK
jgi:uncharacterized protein